MQGQQIEPQSPTIPENDDLPAFLLPFIEEHVCAVESQAAKAAEDASWTHVQKRKPNTQKYTSKEKLLCLQSLKFRHAFHCQ
jgi:hypothetical protein